MGPFREVDQALSPTRRRIEMGRELTVDFKRSPICRAPFLECFEQHRFLFSSHRQRGASALRVETHASRAVEVERMPARDVIERAAGEFE